MGRSYLSTYVAVFNVLGSRAKVHNATGGRHTACHDAFTVLAQSILPLVPRLVLHFDPLIRLNAQLPTIPDLMIVLVQTDVSRRF